MSRAATPAPIPTPTPITTWVRLEELEGPVVAEVLAPDDLFIVLVEGAALLAVSDTVLDVDSEVERDVELDVSSETVRESELEVAEVVAAVDTALDVDSDVVRNAELVVTAVVADRSRIQN